jgi:hypothetical protein
LHKATLPFLDFYLEIQKLLSDNPNMKKTASLVY